MLEASLLARPYPSLSSHAVLFNKVVAEEWPVFADHSSHAGSSLCPLDCHESRLICHQRKHQKEFADQSKRFTPIDFAKIAGPGFVSSGARSMSPSELAKEKLGKGQVDLEKKDTPKSIITADNS